MSSTRSEGEVTLPHTIFYSWQSDLPNATNRGLIQDALEIATKSLSGTLEVDTVIERDTQGVPGAPDIASTIFEKIERSDAFVADVSLINGGARRSSWFEFLNRRVQHRQYPNPNVLIELGYAFAVLGETRVLMVMNPAFGPPEELPFDLRKRRVITYTMPSAAPDRSKERKRLASRLETMLGSCLTSDEGLPLRVSGERRARMVKVLSETPGRLVGLWTDLPKREDWRDTQQRFVESFADTFRSAGWNSIAIWKTELDPQPLGITLVAYEGNTPPSNPDFELIIKALESAGLPFQQRRLPYRMGYTDGISTSDPVLYLGPVYPVLEPRRRMGR